MLSDPGQVRDAKVQFDECQFVRRVLGATGPEHVLVDVGAHYGSSLLPFADDGWTVFAFEPDPRNRQKLQDCIDREPARAARVTVSPLAVSDMKQNNVAFYSSEVSTGISGLHPFHESLHETDRVNTTTLNEFLRERGLSRIDFLKIDVEGHELSVLRGLDFDQVKPRAIVAEFEDAKTLPRYSTENLAKFLEDRGYTVLVSEWHPIERYGITHSWKQLRARPYIPPADSWGNLIAFVSPPDSAALQQAGKMAIRRKGILAKIRRVLGQA